MHSITHQSPENYYKSYTIRLLNSKADTVEVPDPDQANGTHDILFEFWQIHKKHGPEGVQEEIDETLNYINDNEWLRSLVQVPHKHLFHEDELDNLPQTPWLVDDEIPVKGLTVLYGPSGSGKSFLALDYAKRISKDVPVIYVAAEDGSGYKDRNNAYKKYHKAGSGQLYFYLNAPQLSIQADVDSLIEEIESRISTPELLIFDTLARCMTGDENSASDMGKVIRSCDRIREKFNTAIMLVHHTNRGGMEERGSGALRGATDMMMFLKKAGKKITLNCTKSKNTGGFPEKNLRLVTVDLDDGRSSCVIVEANEAVANGNTGSQATSTNEDSLNAKESKIIEYLAHPNHIDKGITSTTLSKETGIPKTPFSNIVKELQKRELIVKERHFDPFKLTEDGKKLAQQKGYIKKPKRR